MELSVAERAALHAAQARDAALAGDRSRRRTGGIVHTPPELARFCARAVDELLVSELGVTRGLADARVHVVDPACGPGAFLAAVQQVAEQHGRCESRITGLDCDAAALDQAKQCVGGVGSGVSLSCVDTLRVSTLPADLAAAAPVLAVIGNPPWTVSASRATPHMQSLLADFQRGADGAALREKKLGVLADAYVRFFRWAIEVACRAKGGAVVALVTNSSFLDGAVHRGMRALMLREFAAVDVVDLGGNALVGRARGTGIRDANVFGVRPGAAVTLLVRKSGHGAQYPERVRHVRMFGGASQKLEALAHARIDDLQPHALTPSAPHFRFAPTAASDARYPSFVSLAECMPFHREGIQSNRDAFVIASDKRELLAGLRAFAVGGESLRSDVWHAATTRLRHYDPDVARARVAEALARDPDGTRGISLRRLAYRAFDDRWFCPVPPLCHRPRPELLAAFDHAPLALVAVRKDRGSAPYTYFGASLLPIDNCFLSTRSSCRARAFPMRDALGHDNLAPAIRDLLSDLVGAAVGAERFVRYALCVIASPEYRLRFESELRMDYPRLPMPTQREHFEACVRAGGELLEQLTACQRGGVVEPGEVAAAVQMCGDVAAELLRA